MKQSSKQKVNKRLIIFTPILGLAVLLMLFLFTFNFNKQFYMNHTMQINGQLPSQQPVTAAPPLDIFAKRSANSPLITSGSWQKYVSEAGHYFIAYPPNWIIAQQDVDTGDVVFAMRTQDRTQEVLLIGVSVSPLKNGWELSNVVKAKLALETDEVKAASIQTDNDILVDGRHAVEIIGREGRFKEIETVFVNNKQSFTIWAQPYDTSHPLFGQWVSDLDAIFHDMIDSFEFSK